jgi:hypothetical protein
VKPNHPKIHSSTPLATLYYQDGSAFVKQLAELKLRVFNPQEFSNTIWALATLNYQDGSIFIKQLLTEAAPKLGV